MIVKTFDDGSEMTGTDLVATAAICLIAGSIAGFVTTKVGDWNSNRIAKKYMKTYTNLKK